MTQLLVNVADTINPETGKTYRQENSEKTHSLPIGALVEVRKYDSKSDTWEDNPLGMRMYVVQQTRDCDQTPLYSLSCLQYAEWLKNRRFLDECVLIHKDSPRHPLRATLFDHTQTGFCEDSLKLLNPSPIV